MADPALIVEVPAGGELERSLSGAALQAVAAGDAVVQAGPTDAQGALESEPAGEVVASLPSPEALRREAGALERVLRHAGTGTRPLVVELEVASALRDEELAPLVDGARHAPRAVILRVLREDTA